MDHLFCCLATLMSTLQRSIVEASLADLVKMVEMYDDGNYPPNNIWFTEKPPLILLFMVCSKKQNNINKKNVF